MMLIRKAAFGSSSFPYYLSLLSRDKILFFLEESNEFDFGLNSKRNEINEQLSARIFPD